ncbi:MAG: hypothetical protein H6Q60_1053 [Oscillospiraceae bacterium]|nr:hypothetical protein [Oscillospiraceae bacterium]
MTTVTFFSEEERVTGFSVSGHSGYAPEGADIVCAAVTSAVRLAECTINEVLGLEASVKARQKDAFISIRLPRALGDSSDSVCQALLTGMMVYLTQLHEEYPEHLLVLEHDDSEV